MANDDSGSGNGSGGERRKWPFGLGGGLAAVVFALIASAVSGLYFEVSVSAPKHLEEITSAKGLLRLVSATLDFGTTNEWRGFIGETRGDLRHIEEVTVRLKELSKYKRAVGESQSADTGAEFSTVGFFGGQSGVLVDLGKTFGFGAYLLKAGADSQIPGPIYFGYLLANVWRNQPGGDTLIARCPFILVQNDVVVSHHLTAEKISDAFGFLGTPCTEFKMPMSLIERGP